MTQSKLQILYQRIIMTLWQIIILSISLKMIRFVFQRTIMTHGITNFIGYGASIFVSLSFILKDVKKIRIINLIGCILFVLYGVFNNFLWPVIIPNGIVCFIQIYQLFKKN